MGKYKELLFWVPIVVALIVGYVLGLVIGWPHLHKSASVGGQSIVSKDMKVDPLLKNALVQLKDDSVACAQVPCCLSAFNERMAMLNTLTSQAEDHAKNMEGFTDALEPLRSLSVRSHNARLALMKLNNEWVSMREGNEGQYILQSAQAYQFYRDAAECLSAAKPFVETAIHNLSTDPKHYGQSLAEHVACWIAFGMQEAALRNSDAAEQYWKERLCFCEQNIPQWGALKVLGTRGNLSWLKSENIGSSAADLLRNTSYKKVVEKRRRRSVVRTVPVYTPDYTIFANQPSCRQMVEVLQKSAPASGKSLAYRAEHAAFPTVFVTLVK